MGIQSLIDIYQRYPEYHFYELEVLVVHVVKL